MLRALQSCLRTLFRASLPGTNFIIGSGVRTISAHNCISTATFIALILFCPREPVSPGTSLVMYDKIYSYQLQTYNGIHFLYPRKFWRRPSSDVNASEQSRCSASVERYMLCWCTSEACKYSIRTIVMAAAMTSSSSATLGIERFTGALQERFMSKWWH